MKSALITDVQEEAMRFKYDKFPNSHSSAIGDQSAPNDNGNRSFPFLLT